MAQRKAHPARSHNAGTGRDSVKQRVMALVHRQQWDDARELCAQLCQRHPDDPEAWFLLGAIHGQRRDFTHAAECCRRTITLSPHASAAHYNLGIALYHLGNFDAAATSFQEAIRLQPNLAEAHHDLGNTYQAIGRQQEAVASYRKALTLRPGMASAHFNLARAYRAQSKTADAIAELRHGVLLDNSNVEARLQLAELLAEQQLLAEAAEQYQTALRLRPEQIEVHVNLGNIFQQLKNIDGAIKEYRAALALNPDSAEAHYNLGNALKAQNHLQEARACYERALHVNPEMAMACNNLGLIWLQEDELDEAAKLFHRAIAINPALTEPWINLAKIAREQLRIEDALEALEHAIRLRPEAPGPHWDRALNWLLLEDFARGWPEYELRWEGGEGLVQRKFNFPRWEGESLSNKTLLIYAEQGIGDEIMFASCYRDIVERAGHVVIDCAPRLAPLFKRSFPRASIHGGAQTDAPAWLHEVPKVDFQIAAGSLPLHTRHSLADFPRHNGYLYPDPSQKSRWLERYKQLGDGLKVGISWRGGHVSQAKKRSTTLEQWGNILRIPGIRWINLQYGSPAQELDAAFARGGVRVHDWEDVDPLVDLDSFAAQIAALDLVISVDNSTVHMAGALGVPTWVLQPYSPDWRWRLDGEDSYWYPSLRQFRQPARGDWQTVLQRVADQLMLLRGNAK